jgi:hypothetical protein
VVSLPRKLARMLIIMAVGFEEWLGRTEFLTPTIRSEPRLESAHHPRNGALLRVQAVVCAHRPAPRLLEMAIFRQVSRIFFT